MLGFRGGIGALCAGAMMMIAPMPAQAATACWAARDEGAARVREMQTGLMVAALRCRAAGIDIAAAYDGFVGAQRGALAAANLVIKTHFAAQGGTQADYDRFTTALANRHGDDETTQATCDEAVALAHEGTVALSAEALQQLAMARMFPVVLPGGACETATAGAALPPIVLAAAPAVERPPVALAPDIVAALVVMARYQSAAPAAPAAKATQVAAIGPR